MPYITSVERIGLERGKQEGRLEGKQATFSRLARARFGPLPAALETRIATSDEATLDAILDRVITVATVEDL